MVVRGPPVEDELEDIKDLEEGLAKEGMELKHEVLTDWEDTDDNDL